MGVVIRLTRTGSTKRPFYRVVAADSRFPRGGRFIEVLGTYDPRPDPPAIQLNGEKINSWIKRGAHPTTTVKSLIKKAGLAAGPGLSAPVQTQAPETPGGAGAPQENPSA